MDQFLAHIMNDWGFIPEGQEDTLPAEVYWRNRVAVDLRKVISPETSQFSGLENFFKNWINIHIASVLKSHSHHFPTIKDQVFEMRELYVQFFDGFTVPSEVEPDSGSLYFKFCEQQLMPDLRYGTTPEQALGSLMGWWRKSQTAHKSESWKLGGNEGYEGFAGTAARINHSRDTSSEIPIFRDSRIHRIDLAVNEALKSYPITPELNVRQFEIRVHQAREFMCLNESSLCWEAEHRRNRMNYGQADQVIIEEREPYVIRLRPACNDPILYR